MSMRITNLYSFSYTSYIIGYIDECLLLVTIIQDWRIRDDYNDDSVGGTLLPWTSTAHFHNLSIIQIRLLSSWKQMAMNATNIGKFCSNVHYLSDCSEKINRCRMGPRSIQSNRKYHTEDYNYTNRNQWARNEVTDGWEDISDSESRYCHLA